MTMEERVAETDIGGPGNERDCKILVNRAKNHGTEEAFLEADDDVMQYGFEQLVELYRAVHDL